MKPLAILSGGTSGIGLATARRLAPKFRLALLYAHDHQRARAAEQELAGARAFAMDLTSPEAVESAYPELEAHFGAPPELLINSAGAGRTSRFFAQGLELEECRKLMDLHYFGTLRLVQKVLPGMYSRRRGTIVNLSSVSARGGYQGVIGYAEAKAAVECFTQNLAIEVAHRGLAVVCVCPGLVETALTAEQFEQLRPETVNFPLGRWLQADEVAQAIEFAVQLGPALNGQILTLDGAGSLVRRQLELP